MSFVIFLIYESQFLTFIHSIQNSISWSCLSLRIIYPVIISNTLYALCTWGLTAGRPLEKKQGMLGERFATLEKRVTFKILDAVYKKQGLYYFLCQCISIQSYVSYYQYVLSILITMPRMGLLVLYSVPIDHQQCLKGVIIYGGAGVLW